MHEPPRYPDPRRRHYGDFYGLTEPVDDGRPLLVIHGNCQAEALRVVIAASTDELATVRVPPVHELTADEMPALDRLLERASVVVTQPIADGWRGLPVGDAQVARRAPGARIVRIPVVRHTGLHPFSALVRTPWMGDPPVVPYHDLRTVLAVHRGARPADGHARPEGYRVVARASLDELRRRELRHRTVPAHDLVEAAGAAAMLTANHPGNAVLVPLAGRVLEAVGAPCEARDPGRTLLDAVRAPRPADVLDALGLDVSTARDTWRVGDREVARDELADAQTGWYADRRAVVDAAVARYAPAIAAMGL